MSESVLDRMRSGELILCKDLAGNGCSYADWKPANIDTKELIAILELGERMRWVSVGERLPELGKEVIVLPDKGKITALSRFIRYEGATEYFWDNYYSGSGNPHLMESISHWMPLPEPPAENDRPEEVSPNVKDVLLSVGSIVTSECEGDIDTYIITAKRSINFNTMRAWDYYSVPFPIGGVKDKQGNDDNGYYFNHEDILDVLHICDYIPPEPPMEEK